MSRTILPRSPMDDSQRKSQSYSSDLFGSYRGKFSIVQSRKIMRNPEIMRNLLHGAPCIRNWLKLCRPSRKDSTVQKAQIILSCFLQTPKSRTTPGIHSMGKASVGSGATSQRATSQRKTCCRDTATRNRYARTHRRPVKTRMPARPSHSSAPKQPRRVPHLVDKKNRWGKVQTGMRESSCESSDSEIQFNGASNTEITTAPVAVSSVVRFPSPSSKPPRLPLLPSRHKGPLPQLDDGGTD